MAIGVDQRGTGVDWFALASPLYKCMLKLSGPGDIPLEMPTPGKFRKRYVMSSSPRTSGTTFVSRYERRIMLVQDVLRKNSTLDEKAAHDLAVHVVYAIDHVAEPTRR